MERIYIAMALGVTLFAAACGTTQTVEPEFEIKGVQLGMMVEDVAKGREDIAVDPLMGWLKGAPSFTLAGIPVGNAFVAYQLDGVINKMDATFPSENFVLVEGAFKSKYPALSCESQKKNSQTYGELNAKVCAAKRIRTEGELVLTDTLEIQEFLPTVSELKNQKVGRVSIYTDEQAVRRSVKRKEEAVEEPAPAPAPRIDPREDI